MKYKKSNYYRLRVVHRLTNGEVQMFDKISIPYESVMLFNIVKLKPNVSVEDVEGLIGEMCYVVKENYPGFLAGQVFKYSGFISKEGSVGSYGEEGKHLAIVTYWKSFAEHEESHSHETFKELFDKLVVFCDDAKELGYELLWQGEQEPKNIYKETVAK